MPWWGRMECSTWNMAQGLDLLYAHPGPSTLALGECSTWNTTRPRSSGIMVGEPHLGELLYFWPRLVEGGNRPGPCSTWNMVGPPDRVHTAEPFDFGGGVFHVEHRVWENPALPESLGPGDQNGWLRRGGPSSRPRLLTGFPGKTGKMPPSKAPGDGFFCSWPLNPLRSAPV